VRATIALTACLLAGCSIPIASLREVAVEGVSRARLAAGQIRGPAHGRSCRWWVLGLPFGVPEIDEALVAAFAGRPALGMRDATVSSDHPVYGLVGQHCYSVRGTVIE
jgi:hypothetical protein